MLTNRRLGLAIAGAWFLVAPAARSARAQTADAPADTASGETRHAWASLTLTLGLGRGYDDNILRMTQENLDRLAADPTSSRFRVTTPDDNLTIVRGSVRWRMRPLPRRQTTLDVSADAYAYERNGVKDWQEYGVTLDQELTASRRHLTSATLWWELEPYYYLRETTDDDDSFAQQQQIRRSLTYAETSTGARLTQEFRRGRAAVSAAFERVHRNYNAYFNERDGDNDQWRFEATVRPWRRSGPSASVACLVGALHARGDRAETEIRDDDISYDHHGVGPSVTLPWDRGALSGRLEAWWMPETREYTTEDKYDVSRYGRVTHRHEVGARLTEHVWGPLDLRASVVHLSTSSEFPPGVVFSPDETEVRQTQVGVEIRGRWRLPVR